MIVTRKEFSDYVEEYHLKTGEDIIDSVLHACDKFSIDPDFVKPLLNLVLKDKLEEEFTKKNYLKRENQKVI